MTSQPPKWKEELLKLFEIIPGFYNGEDENRNGIYLTSTIRVDKIEYFISNLLDQAKKEAQEVALEDFVKYLRKELGLGVGPRMYLEDLSFGNPGDGLAITQVTSLKIEKIKDDFILSKRTISDD